MDKLNEMLGKFEESPKFDKPERDKPVILIIDDDSSIRRGLSRALSHKYSVITVDSAKKGVDVLSIDVHCVILDVKMKEMNGFEAYPKLKEKNPDVPIIFYTAFQSEHDLKKVINEYKPEGYVEKGSDIDLMEELIEKAVQTYKSFREIKEKVQNLEGRLINISPSIPKKSPSGNIPWV